MVQRFESGSNNPTALMGRKYVRGFGIRSFQKANGLLLIAVPTWVTCGAPAILHNVCIPDAASTTAPVITGLMLQRMSIGGIRREIVGVW